jgi:V/A-type H+-transporting ATPase subunit G/H
VEVIINALADLERDIDSLNYKVEEMKKRIMIYSNEEIEKLKQQIITVANDEARKIIDNAKGEAEAESTVIVKESDRSLSAIKKNIDSSYDRAIDSIVKIVLGENTTAQRLADNTDPRAGEITKGKKYTSEGKPIVR